MHLLVLILAGKAGAGRRFETRTIPFVEFAESMTVRSLTGSRWREHLPDFLHSDPGPVEVVVAHDAGCQTTVGADPTVWLWRGAPFGSSSVVVQHGGQADSHGLRQRIDTTLKLCNVCRRILQMRTGWHQSSKGAE